MLTAVKDGTFLCCRGGSFGCSGDNNDALLRAGLFGSAPVCKGVMKVPDSQLGFVEE